MEVEKVLAQAAPLAAVLTNIYTCGATGAVISSIAICNRDPVLFASIRISIGVGGALDSPEQYVYYGLPIPPNDTFIATVGFSLALGDVVRVYSDNAVISVNLFGVEIS